MNGEYGQYIGIGIPIYFPRIGKKYYILYIIYIILYIKSIYNYEYIHIYKFALF